MDSLKGLFNRLWDMGKSSRAATSRDKVLSSGISSSLELEVPLAAVILPVLVFSPPSLALTRSK